MGLGAAVCLCRAGRIVQAGRQGGEPPPPPLSLLNSPKPNTHPSAPPDAPAARPLSEQGTWKVPASSYMTRSGVAEGWACGEAAWGEGESEVGNERTALVGE